MCFCVFPARIFSTMSSKRKRVLIAPLDWGLGHATRSVPVIRAFAEAGAEVFLAADGRGYDFLKAEFPELPLLHFPGYNITYPKNKGLTFHLLLDAPRIIKRIKGEQAKLEELIEKHNIDLVVSDNRFGCWSPKAYCVYITHQLRIQAPVGARVASQVHKHYIEQFNEVWVPDVKSDTENFSGKLAHPLPYKINNIHYIGALTRFTHKDWNPGAEKKHTLLVLLSGPEPQRSLFEDMIIRQLATLEVPTLLLRGIPDGAPLSSPYAWLTIRNHLDTAALAEAVNTAEYVVCRSGYSTICDLAPFMGAPVFVPTPGQTEQEYLAKYFAAKNKAVTFTQKSFDLKTALVQAAAKAPFNVGLVHPENGEALDWTNNVLEERVKRLLS